MTLVEALLADAILTVEPWLGDHSRMWARRYLSTETGRALARIVEAAEHDAEAIVATEVFKARLLALPGLLPPTTAGKGPVEAAAPHPGAAAAQPEGVPA